MSYKSIIISNYGGPEVLKLIETPNLPDPGPHEVRIRVLATCANFTDIMIRKGMYPEVKDKPPFTPGYDMVGVVEKTGNNVHDIKQGQIVADMTVTGACAEYICLPAHRLTPVPAVLDIDEAACLILSYVTAYQLLHRVAKVKKGQKILIHGAGGAVGNAMLQLGSLVGLDMYGTASKARHDQIIANGGKPVDYQNDDFVDAILQTVPEGLDAVFDPIGGKNFKRSFKLLRKGGILAAFGFYNAVMGIEGTVPMDFMKLKAWNLLPNKRKSTFFSIGAMRKKHPDWYKNDLSTLFQLLADKKIAPVIAAKVPIEKVTEAHQLIEKGSMKGKIIIHINNEK